MKKYFTSIIFIVLMSFNLLMALGLFAQSKTQGSTSFFSIFIDRPFISPVPENSIIATQSPQTKATIQENTSLYAVASPNSSTGDYYVVHTLNNETAASLISISIAMIVLGNILLVLHYAFDKKWKKKVISPHVEFWYRESLLT